MMNNNGKQKKSSDTKIKSVRTCSKGLRSMKSKKKSLLQIRLLVIILSFPVYKSALNYVHLRATLLANYMASKDFILLNKPYQL